MSSFGGFGGFGQTTTPASGSGFGGFGSNTNSNTGFSSTGNTGFGSTNTTSGGLFGSGSTGFGSSGGAFGSNNTGTSGFGTKPGGFGSPAPTTGGSIFGNTTTTSATPGTGGFGGFGSTNNNTSGFGGGSTAGTGIFGSAASKPAFGAVNSTAFGSGTSTSAGFGATTGGFGAPASTALGGAVGECQGTGAVAFQPFVEKEPNSTSNQQNSFQSISFQAPYQKFSPEELRLADYIKGQKFGNGSNQAGAFGTNTGFGGSFTGGTTSGFGSNNTNTNANTGGLFGSGTTPSGFGTGQPAVSGFGSNATTGAGLFGAKPAGGGLFGAQTQAQPSGGLFGTSGATTGGFGSTAATGTGFGTANSGSLFGANNNTPKSAFSFGGTQPAAATSAFGTPASGGFGTTGGTSLFGVNTGQQQVNNTPFGGQQQASSTPFGGFGTAQQTGGTGASLFGNNTAKPTTGLFGSTPTPSSGGLFGSTTQPANSAFGATNNQNAPSLFSTKPAATGTGLFGSNTNPQATTGSGGLFGGTGFGAQNQNATQQTGTSSVFGGLNNNNQQKPSLFSSQPGGTGLFGNSGNQAQSNNSLFGNNINNNQQPQPNSNPLFGNSLLGNSQQGGQQNSQSFTASISDTAAYGSASIFANLDNTPVPNPGPIATPLSSSIRQKKSAALPMYKLASASTSRFSTPQKRGFGFSYSNYGTPGSASSTSSTPGAFGGSTLGSTFGRSLKTSVSTSNLRRSFGPEDSILAPGAFSSSPSTRQFGSIGSVKKLNIHRNIRTDLFAPPNPQPATTSGQNGILKKRVSFDAQALNGFGVSSPLKNITNGGASPSSEDLGYIRPPVNGGDTKFTTTFSPEMEQVQNNELAIVHEEDAAGSNRALQEIVVPQEDQQPGQYWMSPSKTEIEKMNRVQRSKVSMFTVGRQGIGKVTFNVPVDLTNIDLDELMGNTIQLVLRSCTVYPDKSKKPPMGKGLNVPATISLQNSWPRKKDGKTPSNEKSGARFKKHVERLKRVGDTEFISYEKDTGVWTFSVEHFTTYGFPDEDDENDGDAMSEFGQSTLSVPPDSPTPKTTRFESSPTSNHFEQSFASISQATHTESDPEDTFDFKRKKILPGAFDKQDAYVEDADMGDQDGESFLDERSVGSQSEDGVEEPMDQDDVYFDDESVNIVDQEMAGSYPEVGNTAELDEENSQDEEEVMDGKASHNALARARLRASQKAATPMKKKFTAGDDWTAALQKTVSPKKQDRAALKSLIDNYDGDYQLEAEPTPSARRVASDTRGFATSIDLMNSLFGQTKSPAKTTKLSATGKGFEWPYTKRPKTGDSDMADMSEVDRQFHDSMKPNWGPDGTLVYAGDADTKPFGNTQPARERLGLLAIQKGGIVSEGRDIRFAKFSNEASADLLKKQKELTVVIDFEGVPFARLGDNFTFRAFCDERSTRDPAAAHEKLVWTLANVLFDDVEVPSELRQIDSIEDRLRKDNLCSFWQKLVEGATSQHIALAKSHEEKAIACLSGHRIAEACQHLINGKNFHIATLIPLIGGKENMRKDMRTQLENWQSSKSLSEFSRPIRALYELLAGNVCVCDGSKGAASEDRVESFVISKCFGLDWRQAFGLRLWYGILPSEFTEIAVAAFAGDLSQDKETAFPQAWYVEEKIPPLWEDDELENREDLLWGLLKVYTYDDPNLLQEVLTPSNSQLSPADSRLSWQLSQAITTTNAGSYSDPHKADELTLAFASQLTNEGSWLDAVFVLLHISSAEPRMKAIQDHLARFAGNIGSEDSQSFSILTKDLRIPAPWVWEAKALYMRSVERNPQGEVECLINAGSFIEAHRTFSREVAPKNIVELDYDALQGLLVKFQGMENAISDWNLGGQIYSDFLELAEYQKRGSEIDRAILGRLLTGLPAVVEDSRHPSFMERVAIETISSNVAKVVITMGKAGQKADLPKILRLPLTEDKYLKYTVDLSLEYYRSMVSSR